MLFWNLFFVTFVFAAHHRSSSSSSYNQTSRLSCALSENDLQKNMAKIEKLFNDILNLDGLHDILMKPKNSKVLQDKILLDMIQEQEFCLRYEPLIEATDVNVFKDSKVKKITMDPKSVTRSSLKYAIPFCRQLTSFQRVFDVGCKFKILGNSKLPSKDKLRANYCTLPVSLDQIVSSLTTKFVEVFSSVDANCKRNDFIIVFFIKTVGRYSSFMDAFKAFHPHAFTAEELEKDLFLFVHFLSGENFSHLISHIPKEKVGKIEWKFNLDVDCQLPAETLALLINHFHLEINFKTLYSILIIQSRNNSKSQVLKSACKAALEKFRGITIEQEHYHCYTSMSDEMRRTVTDLGIMFPQFFSVNPLFYPSSSRKVNKNFQENTRGFRSSIRRSFRQVSNSVQNVPTSIISKIRSLGK